MERVAFIYWGRRGSLSQFTLELAEASERQRLVDATFSVSRNNESFDIFAPLGDRIVPVDTFVPTHGALSRIYRVPTLRQAMLDMVARRRIQWVVNLMPHVWSPFVTPAIQATGARYAAVVHDARRHPGDHRGLVNWWTLRDARNAELLFTLSSAVGSQLGAMPAFDGRRIVPLQHPELTYGQAARARHYDPGRPIRLMFLGRIMPYKGLGNFLDMIENLRAVGLPVEFGVFGEGLLGADGARIEALGGEIVNRWMAANELPLLLDRFDAVVLSHIEASQSGVVATAHGAGMPVVATPVGGLIEQIRDGETGVLAERADGAALAQAVLRLVKTPGLYDGIAANILRCRAGQSMESFLARVVENLAAMPKR